MSFIPLDIEVVFFFFEENYLIQGKHIMASNLTETFTEVAEKIQEQMNKGNTRISVFAGATKMPIINNYALLFHTAFLQTIDEYNLALNDVRVMLKIIELMKFGNLVHISWTKIAKDLKIMPKNMSRHINKLKQAKLLLSEDGNIFLNPQIIAKGKFLQKGDDDTIKLLEKGAEALEGTNIKPNILTPKMQNGNKNDN